MRKPRTKADKEFQRQSDCYDEIKFKCKCGHRTVIPRWVEKQICSWCGHWVYRNKKTEFKDKLKERMVRINERI
ncbi:MAG: hypothetical protein J6B89_03610 [Bacilli bacterium]|nr:hypothetical protein [Bacilli bacterium]